MTLTAGSIAFTGFNADGNDNLAFVALEAISAGTVIYFSDNEWNQAGTGFSDFNENTFAWTASSAIAAGTIVTLNDVGVSTPAPSSNLGTIAAVAGGGTNRGIGAGGETIYAYIAAPGTPLVPTSFLAAVTTSGFASVASGYLTNTGLTEGVNALNLQPLSAGNADIAAYVGGRSGLASFAAYGVALNTAANFNFQDGTGDQSIDGTAPDVPFSTTAFTIAAASATVAINDVSITEGNAGTSILTFTVTRSIDATAFSVDFATANGSATAGSDYIAASGTISFTAGGALTQAVSVTINGDTAVEANETFAVELSNLVNTTGTTTIADAQGVGTITNDDVAAVVITAIHDIQGAAHISPLVGQSVTTTGIVTAVDSNGFYLQAADADADANIATSEAIFIFTSSAPSVVVGQAINVTGTVNEFIPGGAATRNLSTTQLVGPSAITVLSSGNALPAAIVLGAGGRPAPTANIDDDGLTSFDAATDGIDYFESLEAMRVTVPAPRVVAATNSFGEIFTVADGGTGATGLSARGTIVTQGSVGDGLAVTNSGPGSDFNPERIQIDADPTITPGGTPLVDVGAVLNDVTGVLGYNFGNFEVIPTSEITVATQSILTAEVTALAGVGTTFTIASYNTKNLDANDADGDTDVADGRFAAIALDIVANLGTPDIIALQEIQDNSGSTNDGTVSASVTLQTLVNAIIAAGGPTYAFIDNPFITNNTNGGQPGGNIRVAYLYDASRVSLVTGSLATTPNAATDFAGSRQPLIARFAFGTEEVTVINNHFSSKGGSSPLYGSTQLSLNGSADARLVQAQNVADYVSSLAAGSKVVVLGDLNEFTNEESLAPLGTAGLSPLSLTLAPTERYSFVFEGNAQELDQVYVSNNLTAQAALDIVHVNSEFADTAQSASDHDPSVLALNFAPAAQSLRFAAGSLAISQAEGNTGTTVYSFVVERSGGSVGQVDFSGAISGTADAADFGSAAPAAFSGSIAAGSTSTIVTVSVVGDTRIEANDNFSLTLTNVANTASAAVTIAAVGATATGTIVNDDLIDLSTYVRVGRYDLPEPTRTAAPPNSVLAQEVSAVTYNTDTNTLFVLGDGGTSIVQVSLTGQLINSMTLAPGSSPQGTTFFDPEGLAYIGNGQFVFTEERDRNAVKFTYVADTVLTRADAQTANLGTFVGNIGLEGVTYDPLTNGYIFVKEKTPEGIFQTTIDFATNTASNGSATTVNSINLFDPALLNLIDIADVYALSNVVALNGTGQQGSLLVLSQESGQLVLVNRSGIVASRLTIVSDPGNPLDVVAQQHEGVTVGPDGTIYIVSENGGGDFDHPQLWVYRPSLVPNQAPTAITLANATTAILENTSTAARIKVADIVITDDSIGTNNLTVTGADAAAFEVDSTGLYIRAGTLLDFETKASYSVTVNVDDPGLGATPDASAGYTLNITDVANENALPNVYVSEVAPWSSGNSAVAADWFEITNGGSAALNINGWRIDDNSNSFGASVALTGVTSIAAGESVIFIEAAPAAAAATIARFIATWFGGTAPTGVQIGTYSGSGIGLSTGGDAVNLYDTTGTLRANVSFGASPAGPFATFNNAAGLNNAAISALSTVGTNGAYAANPNEIGSPGSVGRLIISEVAPWSSGNSPVGADWFEVSNTSVAAINIAGWKIDDNSQSPVAAVALLGVTTIAAGESVIFIEATPTNAAATIQSFINTWFGGNVPANLQIGTYSGAGVGLGTGGDAVNLYDATNRLRASVSFGASPTGPFATFDNAAGLNNAAIAQLSVVGANGAHRAANDTAETGSPGGIVARNDAPIGVNDAATGVTEDGPIGATGNVLTNDTDADLVQTVTEVLRVNGVRAGTELAGGTLAAVTGATIVDGIYGSLTLNTDGSYSYALDNGRPVTQALVAGQSVTDSFTYRVVDASGLFDTAQVNIAITGTYDAGDPLTGTQSGETINGTNIGELINGLGGNDTINGNGGNDTISGGTGDDRLDGGAGNDTASYADADAGVMVRLAPGGQATGGAGFDTLSNFENLLGSRFDDVLRGDLGVNRLMGGAGNDALFGARGDDILFGGLGNDFLEGGVGRDSFVFDAVGNGDVDVISDFSFAAGDTLVFGPGVTVTGVQVGFLSTTALFNGQDVKNSGGSLDIVLTLSSSAGSQLLHVVDAYGAGANSAWESFLGIDLTYPQPLPVGSNLVNIIA